MTRRAIGIRVSMKATAITKISKDYRDAMMVVVEEAQLVAISMADPAVLK